MDTQGEETIGIVSFDEQTDFDNEFGILKALNLFQNEQASKPQVNHPGYAGFRNNLSESKKHEESNLIRTTS